MQLRPYQREALEAALTALEAGHNPALQLATGTGKSLIIAALAEHYRRAGRRVWVLTHVQQLVGQNAATFHRYAGVEPAIICAGLARRDLEGGVTFGTVQSMMSALGELADPHLVIIDEAHRVPHNDGEPTLYERILRRYPAAQRVAMTATPWRMDNGIIYGQGERFWFDRLAYAYPVPRAVAEGWLAPLVGVETEVQLDVEGIDTSGGDFTQLEVEQRETEAWLAAVVDSVARLAEKRRHVAVYCPTVASAQRAAKAFTERAGWGAAVMTGADSPARRSELLGAFAAGELRVLCSVDTITTGFDLPALDCIVCLRPTLSSSLWVQIQGRGTRLHPGKKNCLVLDYAGNLIRLGGVGLYEKFYREAGLVEVDAAEPRRPHVKRERRRLPGLRSLTPLDPMTGEPAGPGAVLRVEVHEVSVVALTTRRNPAVPVLLVQYACTTAEGARLDAATFINTEQPNRETLGFFERRALAVKLPAPARGLTWQLRGARRPTHATVRKSGRYWNITAEHFGDTHE